MTAGRGLFDLVLVHVHVSAQGVDERMINVLYYYYYYYSGHMNKQRSWPKITEALCSCSTGLWARWPVVSVQTATLIVTHKTQARHWIWNQGTSLNPNPRFLFFKYWSLLLVGQHLCWGRQSLNKAFRERRDFHVSSLLTEDGRGQRHRAGNGLHGACERCQQLDLNILSTAQGHSRTSVSIGTDQTRPELDENWQL